MTRLIGSFLGIVLLAGFLSDSARTQNLAQTNQPERIRVEQREAYIPDLLMLDWIDLYPQKTVVQFRFLREFCQAALNMPSEPESFRLVAPEKALTVELIDAEGVLRPGAKDVCGRDGDTFRVTFPAIPRDVTFVNIHEGAGGRVGAWSWFKIRVR